MTPAFKCPPMPPEEKAAARRQGRLDYESGGNRMTRKWYWDRLAEHMVAVARLTGRPL